MFFVRAGRMPTPQLMQANHSADCADDLNCAKAEIRLVRRLDEFNHKSEREVKKKEKSKQRAARMRVARAGVNDRADPEYREDLVELGGVELESVTEIDSPRQSRGLAVGVIG